MVAPSRTEGLVAGVSWAQLAPFQLQVSFRYGPVLLVAPPNSMVWPVAGSKASALW
jgi:hypothetical protein